MSAPTPRNKPRKKHSHKAPVDARVAAVLATKPTVLDEKFTIAEDQLLYDSKSGKVLALNLDPTLDALEAALGIDQATMSSEDLGRTLVLLRGLVGDDAKLLRTSEIMPVFERWAYELAIAMGGVTLPESDGSETS